MKHSQNPKEPQDVFPEQPRNIFAIFQSDVVNEKQKEPQGRTEIE